MITAPTQQRNTSTPRVSVILNCFNQRAYVVDAVESVLAQVFAGYELLVIDNGSTDGTPDLLRRYEADPRVRLFLHTENVPITRRFNEGVAAARGEFISFLYSDDLYLPDKLATQVAAFDALPADYGVVYGPSQGWNVVTGERWTYGSIGASGWILKDMFLRYERGQIDMIAPLTRRDCLVRYPFDEQIFAEGESVFFRVAMAYRFHHLATPLSVGRDHTANAGKATRRNADMTMASLARLAAHPDFPPDHRPYLEMYRATLFRNYGWQTIRTGTDVRWARRCFADAFRTHWQTAVHPRVFAGLALSVVPAPLRRLANRLADGVRPHHHNSVHVEDFGGAIGKY